MLQLAFTYCNRKQQNGVGRALNEATLLLILYRKVKNIEHVIIVRTTCHISCFITFLASAIPTAFLMFFLLVYIHISSLRCPKYLRSSSWRNWVRWFLSTPTRITHPMTPKDTLTHPETFSLTRCACQGPQHRKKCSIMRTPIATVYASKTAK